MPHVLDGVRVLDLTRVLAGPSCTRSLAEMGAEVVKIEPAPSGDMVRRISKYRGGERSLYYIQQNRGKKSVCVDLRDPRGLELVASLVEKVDVVVENYRPGTMAEMGLGYEELRRRKRDVILCSISAFGQTGPLATQPGYDYIAQAYSGVTSMIGDPDDGPMMTLAALGDVNTGVQAALAVVGALRHRDRTGEGQWVEVSLLDVYYHCHEVSVHSHTGSDGKIKPTRSGRHMNYVCPAGIFRVTGGFVMIMGFLHHWKDLCAAMERPDLVSKPGWENDLVRLERRDEVVATIEGWLAGFPDVAAAVAHMQRFGVPVAPILSIEETVKHPHLVERGTVRTVNDRYAGEFKVPGFPLRFSAFPQPLPLEAATLGEHNVEVVCGLLGRSREEVDRLTEAGVLLQKEV